MIATTRGEPIEAGKARTPWLPPADSPPHNRSRLRASRGGTCLPEESIGEACLHELFEAQAGALPDVEALVVRGVRLTYRELNRRANRVAHHLRQLGVGPEDLVGVFLDRSEYLVIAILGILKAGGAYLPLDPAYPADRLSFMLEDAQVRTLVTQSSLREAVPAFKRAAGRPMLTVCLDTDRDVAIASPENPNPLADCKNLAYVIYTSGSTGKPKGVAIEHRNALALIRWAAELYSANELDGVLAGSSICFDASILDLFVPLSLGGKVILAANTLSLPGLEEAQEVRMFLTVPSVIRELLRIGGIPTSVETLNLGGEPLSPQLVDQLYALPHIRRVYDLYGPTEITTCATFALRAPGGPATIGRPITRTQVYVLDEHLKPVATGTTGELFIGGEGVARGYLNRPGITAEKFIPAPFPGVYRDRLYRTGDLCRLGPDGNLEFIGRIDQQVKIRGFRVELGEIESVLLAHPAVAEAVVIAHQEAPGVRWLVAYVLPRRLETAGAADPAAAGESRIIPQLRSHLQELLPDYMMPGAYVLVDRFELTGSGKINRLILPAPARSRSAAGDYLAPSTPTEVMLSRIWADLLGVQKAGVHDDFLQLGGDSLLGVAMLAEIERQTGLKLPAEAVLHAPTLGRLAALVDDRRRPVRPPAASSWVTIQPQGSRPRLFLVHGVGGGMLWEYANLARHLGTDQPIYAFKACDPDQLADFDSIEKVAAQYVRELRRFQPEGPYLLGGYCFGGNVAYEMCRMLEEQGQRVSLLALMNASPPNSSYDQIRWTPLYVCKFLYNLGHLLTGFLQWKFGKQRRFLLWKAYSARRKAARWLRMGITHFPNPEVDELVDLSAVPNEERCLWESHVRMLNLHKTKPYGGRIVLYRTKGHPLNSSYDRQCGWSELALGGVEVRMLPGLHESLLEEPFVRGLAREMKVDLDALQAEPRKSP